MGCCIVWLATMSSPLGLCASLENLSCPADRITVEIEMPQSGRSDSPTWSLEFMNHPLLEGCEFSLNVYGRGNVLAGAKWLATERREHRERIPVLFGKSAETTNHFRESVLSFLSEDGYRIQLRFRCYSDAIAFRYELLAAPTQNQLVIADEATSFHVVGQPKAMVQYLENHRTSHEHEVATLPLGQVEHQALLDLPLTLQWPDGITAVLTEAALRNYAGMALSRERDVGSYNRLRARLTPRPDGNKVVASLPLLSPWRVLLVGERAGALLESNTLYCLNEPSVLEDISWIKPDKLTFHWWNGDVFDGIPGDSPLSIEMARRYIDFCADQGLNIHAISSTQAPTSPWYHQVKPGVAPGPETDVTRPRESFDLEAIRAYADLKGIRLWTWVHQDALRGRVEEAFAAFEKMGWQGMMVDFFDHDDQDHVLFAEEILAAAARHHILIHFHGIWKPTGLRRTYPNLMNHEGALNLEYLKWSDRCTPTHNLHMAFTRLMAGPMDYHLGGFRAVTADAFEARQVAPLVLGTRCHMLAMYVCFDNPAPMVADYPQAYLNQPGFDFLMAIPTWWDETRVLHDELGECLVMARRRDRTWYLGGMCGERSHDLSLDLSNLLDGKGQLELWEDVAARFPNRLSQRKLELSADQPLTLHLEPGGGVVGRLNQAPSPTP